MAMKLLFVVHRYGYPGGSEIYTQSMAEECLRRGHAVAVFAGEHRGDMNGVVVSNNPNILMQPWDLIIVHGGDVSVQDFVLSNATVIASPVLWLLVLPSQSAVCLQALQDCDWLGCSTAQDWDHCALHGVGHKAVRIRHGVTAGDCLGRPGFKARHGINTRMFLSCGGYWPNKAMQELARLWTITRMPNAVLVTTGYDNRMNLMPEPSAAVLPLLLDDRSDVLSAMSEADCVIMHSYTEGFGLVLLEAMLNRTPWIARRIAGAALLQDYGKTYQTNGEFAYLLKKWDTLDFPVAAAYDHVMANHLIANTVDDILAVIEKT